MNLKISHRNFAPLRLCVSLFASLFLSSFAVANAQTSFLMIGDTYPTGVQRGKTTLVTVEAGGTGGTNFYGAYKAMFEGEGIKSRNRAS